MLLHGHPRTHAAWHRVAPVLAERGFTVVCPDLRGYGRSAKPDPDPEHLTYCDRGMAGDVVALMSALGHETFAITGHDRGGYVAYRAALDFPDRVSALAVCDGVPILEALERADRRFATEWWHWFFFGASPHAERVITADPLARYRPDESSMGRENHRDMVAAVTDPRTVRAMLKERPGKEIALFGSVQLTASLPELNLVDELRVMVFPILLGEGVSMFSTLDSRTPLELLRP